jgi:RNA polymerase sigma-70 factor (ECF subfamily)
MPRPQPGADQEAVAALAERYRPAVLAYFSRRVRDRGEAEDLTQEVFVSLVRRAELETIDNIEGYIFRIAANLLGMRSRTAGRRPAISAEGYDDPARQPVDELSPERFAIGHQSWEIFVQALQELPERTRTIFVLNRFEELSGREIAIRLGVSVSLVEKDMIKAIAYLRGRVS